MAASPTERSWCALEFVAVQRAFRRQFGRLGPPETSIRRWYEQFRYRGCICHQVLQNTPIIYTHSVFSWILLRMRNVSDKCCKETQSASYVQSPSPRRPLKSRFLDNVEKSNAFCAIMVTPTRYSVIRTLPILLFWSCFFIHPTYVPLRHTAVTLECLNTNET
jgi:hypothetical protein